VREFLLLSFRAEGEESRVGELEDAASQRGGERRAHVITAREIVRADPFRAPGSPRVFGAPVMRSWGATSSAASRWRCAEPEYRAGAIRCRRKTSNVYGRPLMRSSVA